MVGKGGEYTRLRQNIEVRIIFIYISISIKRSAKRLFANSFRERRRIETKLSQPSDTVSDLDLRGSACANKLLPRSARRRNRPSAILDLHREKSRVLAGRVLLSSNVGLGLY